MCKNLIRDKDSEELKEKKKRKKSHFFSQIEIVFLQQLFKVCETVI